MKKQLNNLKEKYSNLMDEINILKASGNLSKLYNLRNAFDETFDQFFDRKELRIKYTIKYHDAWDHENDTFNADVSNADLEESLENEDLKDLIQFYRNYIAELEDQKRELENN